MKKIYSGYTDNYMLLGQSRLQHLAVEVSYVGQGEDAARADAFNHDQGLLLEATQEVRMAQGRRKSRPLMDTPPGNSLSRLSVIQSSRHSEPLATPKSFSLA
jgi:hypothetical protein